MQINEKTTDYYATANRNFLFLLIAHIPLAGLVAYLCDTSVIFAFMCGVFILSVPSILFIRDRRSLECSISLGVALLSFSALLIHSSRGMTEMHFHIFSSLGLLIILAQPMAVIFALLTVVLHHVGFFFLLPSSLINYQASFSVLIIHALFALATGVPSAFISKKFKLYITSVKGLIEEVENISLKMEDFSQDMLGTANTLSESTNKEAAAMHETAASLVELQSMIAKNSENAQSTSRKSDDAKEQSERGARVMAEVILALGMIQNNSDDMVSAVDESNKRISKIITVIHEIENKTKVINDIVFQTKLLSFNASVEAARAGVHGSGFAVVAEEVGKLAQMSGASAKEISALLEESSRTVSAIVSESKSQVESIVGAGKIKIQEGVRVANDCKSVLHEISTGVISMASAAKEISAASREQTSGVSEITRAMSEVEKATQQNTEVAGVAANTATQLNIGAQQLKDSVSKLVRAVESKRAA